jgi:signal transduction histidine kinase/CheY-like chemotaxis protein
MVPASAVGLAVLATLACVRLGLGATTGEARGAERLGARALHGALVGLGGLLLALDLADPWSDAPASGVSATLTVALAVALLVGVSATEVALELRRRRRGEPQPAEASAPGPVDRGGPASRSELLRAEQLASLGLASSALAHEVGSPLSAALAGVERAREAIAGPSGSAHAVAERAGPREPAPASERAPAAAPEALQAAEQALDDARRSILRVGALLDTLAALTVEVDAPARAERVDAALDAALALTRALLLPRARVAVRGERGLGALVQPGALPQVLVNLLVHAAHAIPEGRGAPGRVEVTTATEGAAVSIEVWHDGDGMDGEALRALFQLDAARPPGVSVGLAIARRVVDRHGGHMEVESVVGQGTALRVYFPAAAAPGAAAPARAGGARSEVPDSAASERTPGAADTPAPRRRATVLLVDDEALLVRVTARLLGREFDVVTAPSAEAARACVAKGRLPDVVLCDLLLPGSSGKDVFLTLCRAHPALADRFTFVTGGAADPVLAAFPAQVGRPVLRKPVDPDALAAHVRAQDARALGARQPD